MYVCIKYSMAKKENTIKEERKRSITNYTGKGNIQRTSIDATKTEGTKGKATSPPYPVKKKKARTQPVQNLLWNEVQSYRQTIPPCRNCEGMKV